MDDDLFKENDSDIAKVGRVNKHVFMIFTFHVNINYDSHIGYYSISLTTW